MFRQLQLLRPTFLVQFVIILSLSVSSAEPLSSLKTRQGHVNNPLADQHLNVLWVRTKKEKSNEEKDNV